MIFAAYYARCTIGLEGRKLIVPVINNAITEIGQGKVEPWEFSLFYHHGDHVAHSLPDINVPERLLKIIIYVESHTESQC